MHIDFGFFLQNSPGNMGFESAPFKFTQEYLEIIGGQESDMFEYFKSLMIRGLIEVRKHLDELIDLIKIMAVQQLNYEPGKTPMTTPAGTAPSKSSMPCFKNMVTLEQEIRDRVSGKFNKNPKLNEF